MEMEVETPYILIPVRMDTTQNVQVFLDELPVVTELVDVLKAEVASLDLWLRFAVEYYHQGKKEEFREILVEIIGGLTPEREKFYSDDPEGFKVWRLRILNALAADAVKRANASTEKRDKEEFHSKALEYLAGADRIDPMSELTWVGKGIFYLSQGDLSRARYFFDNAVKGRENLPATLGQASIYFQEAKYKEALDLYCKVLQENPKSSASVRVGLGLCCYRLGQMSRAKAAMKRALQLDPKCAEALVGCAILEMATANKDPIRAPGVTDSENPMLILSRAYNVDPTNSMALNHLANHFFWTWTLLKGPTASVTSGSSVIVCSSSVHNILRPGDFIRIGQTVSTRVDPNQSMSDFDGIHVRLTEPYPHASASDVSIYTKDYEKVCNMAKEAYGRTEVPEIRAESCFIQGRVHHAQGRFPDARYYYNEACKFWPQFALAQYGLAQMLVHEGKLDDAVNCLNLVLAQVPDNQESLLLLGMLYAKLGQRKPALVKFKQALELNPFLREAWLAQAQVFQQDSADYELALASYRKALGVPGSGQLSQSVQQAIWSNIAVLQEYVDKLPEAEHAYEVAWSLIADDGTHRHTERVRITDPANKFFWRWQELPGTAKISAGDPQVETFSDLSNMLFVGDQIRIGSDFVSEVKKINGPNQFEVSDFEVTGLGPELEGQVYKKALRTKLTPDTVSITFNLALLHEKQGHHEAAAELYKAILAEHPNYVNCYLRLSCIARDSGNINEASRWFKQAIDIDKDNPDVLAYIGNLRMRSGEWGPAQKNFEKILSMPDLRTDSYAMLSLGNIYFSNLEDKGKYEKHLQHAANFYQQILLVDISNSYAANGLGMVLAEKGMLDQAKDVFARVREASSEILGDVWVNLAHVYLALNKHNEAIRLYQNCLKKFHGGRDASLHMYLAHAYFEAGRYKECMRTLLKALHVQPSNLRLWYNLALTRETFAVTILQKEQKGEQRTLAEVQNAIDDLQGATKLFSWLGECEPESGKKQLPYSAEKAKKHASFCDGNINNAKQHLAHERQKEQEKNMQREKRQQQLELLKHRKTHEEEEKERLRRESQASKEARARKQQEALQLLQANWSQSQGEAKSSKKKKQSASEQVPEYRPPSDGEESEDAAPKSNDEEEEAGDRYNPKPPAVPVPAPKNLREMGLDSSDESDNDNDANAAANVDMNADVNADANDDADAGSNKRKKSDSDDQEEGPEKKVRTESSGGLSD